MLFSCLAEIDISRAELEKADEQQHNRYSGHGQEVVPVHAEENRVAIQVEDGERHDPRGHWDHAFEQLLHEGQSDIRAQEAQHSGIAQAPGLGVDQANGNQRHREHVEAGGKNPALVNGEMGELCPNQDSEPGQDRSQQDHQDICAEAFQQDA